MIERLNLKLNFAVSRLQLDWNRSKDIEGWQLDSLLHFTEYNWCDCYGYLLIISVKITPVLRKAEVTVLKTVLH